MSIKADREAIAKKDAEYLIGYVDKYEKPKTRYTRVNMCERCGEKAGHFIWTTSAQVNAGIYTMYGNAKICLHCMKELREVYPDKKIVYKEQKCPLCSGKIVTTVRGVGYMGLDEKHCEDCGLVVK